MMADDTNPADQATAATADAADRMRAGAEQARELFKPEALPGPTGESNTLQLSGRGTFVCISPWNFPLAIFMGQVCAALAAGNCVIAKPAEQTNLVGYAAVKLLHEALGHIITVELKTGQLYRGKLLEGESPAATQPPQAQISPAHLLLSPQPRTRSTSRSRTSP